MPDGSISAQALSPTVIADPFLATVWGASIVALALVIAFLFRELRAAYGANSALHEKNAALQQATHAAVTLLQEKNAELQRAMLERVLTGMNTMGGVVSDNTKAMEAFIRSKP